MNSQNSFENCGLTRKIYVIFAITRKEGISFFWKKI